MVGVLIFLIGKRFKEIWFTDAKLFDWIWSLSNSPKIDQLTLNLVF